MDWDVVLRHCFCGVEVDDGVDDGDQSTFRDQKLKVMQISSPGSSKNNANTNLNCVDSDSRRFASIYLVL
jgi:hypothetical protein